MRIKTLFLTLAVTLLASMTSISVYAAKHVKVSDKDGNNTYFALSDKPTVTFTSTAMVLTAGSQTIEYPLTDFRAFAFEDDPLSIESLNGEGNNAVFSYRINASEGRSFLILSLITMRPLFFFVLGWP